jgi:GH35 family endo-1,4-beta-xylanase
LTVLLAGCATGAANQSPVAAARQKLARQDGSLFRVFLKNRRSARLVTFWGMTGADSWRTNGSPLRFDANRQPKPACDAIIRTANRAK